MIIDGHAHIYPEANAEKIISSFTDLHRMQPTDSLGKGTIDDLCGRMAESCTDYTVLANFAPVKNVDKVNSWTLGIAKEHPNIIPLVSVYPYMKEELLCELFDKGAKGIKMHNGIQGYDPSDKGLDVVYHFCEKKNIPITFHCGETSRVHMNGYTDMSHIIPVIKRYPGITFVLTHLAAGDPETVLGIADQCDNVIFDTSITFTGEKCIYRIHDNYWEDDENAVSAFKRIGFHRIAFGSDYPFGNPKSDIRRIKGLVISDEEKDLILGVNSMRLYKIGYN